jgi:glycerate kinase
MRALIAPDKFKGSLSAIDAATAIAAGFERGWPECQLVICPLADGGEGTLEVLVRSTGGREMEVEVTGPLGETRKARLGILGEGDTAVVEMAQASGLELVPPDMRDARMTTTRGTGDLVRAALDSGIRKIIVGIGGSATNDGGAGMATALGARFLDAGGRELPPGGAALKDLQRVDLSGLDPRIKQTEIVVASDVINTLCGDEGASRVFAPQKGAGPQDVELLEACMSRLDEVCAECLDLRLAQAPGAGAAGGLGFGLMAFLGARIRPGIDVVMEYTRFESKLGGCGLVVTGEGKLDSQTALGKTVLGVGRVAGQRGIPVLGLAGAVEEGAEVLHDLGISCILSISPGPISLEQSQKEAGRLLEKRAREVASLLKSLASG